MHHAKGLLKHMCTIPLNVEKWILIQELVRVLKPLEDTTQKLNPQNLCISDVIYIVEGLSIVYEEIQISANTG